MALAVRFDIRPAAPAGGTLGTRTAAGVVRDLAVLVGSCLAVGLAAGLGMMLAVLAVY